MVRCYHYCTNEFLVKLKEKQKIYANNEINLDCTGYVKEYVFKEKQLNNGNGMFFCWTHPDYKGPIEYDENGEYSLLELEIPDEFVIKTNYENWCSFEMDLQDADGDLELADKICRTEFGIKDGITGSYNSIFDISDEKMEVQILLPHMDINWVKSVKKCSKRYI